MNQQSLFDHSPGNILFEAVRICVFLFLVLIILPVFFGCGTLSNGRGWGQDATLTPGRNRIKESAVKAALSPETWIPVAISMGLMIDEADERITDWASNNHPLFGSQENADKWSDYLACGSGAAYLITTMATPSGDNPSDWLEAKAKGLALGAAASGITAGSTKLIVEANKHNPSDVLVGYALGHFLSAFINDAFLGLDHEKAPFLNIEQSDKGISISLNRAF